MSYEGAMDFSDGSSTTTEYSWDKNGNMTRDLNRKIFKIGYNSLNLPETITYTDGHKVMNTYDCLGRKVSVIYQVSVPSVTTPQADGSSVTSYSYRTYMRRSYSGNCIYRNDTLERILTTTGYITPEGEYHHYLKDYQGNNRMVLNESGQTIERTDYYPYGMSFADSEHHQPYKYSGKELETMNGLRHLDYGARWMDYPVGRFTTIDRYCEKYYNLSPYLYCAGNPINNIDINGDSIAVLIISGEHLAMLIQNQDSKWAYFSLNGDKTFASTSGKHGGKDYHDLGEKTFDSPQAFLNSSYNQEGTKEQKESNEVSGFEYVEAYVLPATSEQDKKMQNEFVERAKDGYNVMFNQCAQAVRKTMSVGNLGIWSFLGYPYFPSIVMHFVKNKYPNGTSYKK